MQSIKWLCAIALLLAASGAHAWSGKEHIQMTRLAVERLLADPTTPPAMRAWLKQVTPGLLDMTGERIFLVNQHIGIAPRGVEGLLLWSVMPDLIRDSDAHAERNPLGPERLMHYIDLEAFNSIPENRCYADDLSHKPAISDVPRDAKDPRFQKAGLLPFRIEQCYASMVRCIRSGQMGEKASPPDDHAARWAGYLAHYLADNTMPMHATIDYRAASYFSGVVRPPNVHGDAEYRLVDDEQEQYPELREEYWELLSKALVEGKDPVVAHDLWRATLEISLISYDALPIIGRAARAAYIDDSGKIGAFKAAVFFHFKGRYMGREMTLLEMKARQQAWAVRRIAAIWRQAWDEAHSAPQR